MKLLVLASEFPPGPGGIGTHAWQLARELGPLGWEVAVAARQAYATPGEIAAFNREQPFPITPLGPAGPAPLTALVGGQTIAGCLRRFEPRLLLASGDRVIYLTAWVARRQRVRWVAVEHGRTPPAWERRLKRRALEAADGVVGVSRFTWEQLPAQGIRPRQGRVIPNGADPGCFRRMEADEAAAFRRSLGWNGARLLITVGNVTERKGQDIVIRALPRVLERAPQTRYLVVGLPTRQRELEELAAGLGVGERVHFLGRVEAARLVGLLNVSDVFVLTSRRTREQFEGYGIAVAEAALCGLPAVVAGGSGLSEAIVDGETGLEAPPEDPTAAAQAILKLLEDESCRRALGEAARRRALAEQTWAGRARQYDEFLRSLL